MIRILKIIFAISIFSLVTGCDFISNTFIYKDKTKEFVETLLKEDYNKCINLMAMDHEMAKNYNPETLKIGLANFRKILIENWGTELEYSFMKSEKTFSTDESENIRPNTTRILIEFNNNKDYGVFQVLFDDNSKKILNIKALDIKSPIPAMSYFWLLGLIFICIPIFNIYVIRQIKRSALNKKWLKYIAVVLLNIPSITYSAINGISIDFSNFQFLLGISFGYIGYENSYWTLGIPLGGLYWFWKLKQRNTKIIETEISNNPNIEDERTSGDNKSTIE